MSKNEQKITVPTVETTQVTIPTVAGLKKAAAPVISEAAHRASEAAHKAGEWGSAAAHEAGEWAKPRLEQGKASAQPVFAVANDKTGELRDRFTETMPKLSEAIAAAIATGAGASQEAARRSSDAALVLRGEADIRRKKKGRGIVKSLGIAALVLATAGAAGLWFKQKQEEADDPWARPLTDPYAAPTSGRDSSLGAAVSTASEAPGDSTAPADPDAVTEDVISPPEGQVVTENDKRD
ncbi:MAG: hypothetical protein Q4G51_04725 [Dermatophilus congolensis]|nr:hypothetical protein [Dermatophilus congolensis]